MSINENDCSNNYKCWECNEICSIKKLVLLPENIFMIVLNKVQGPLFADFMLNGYSFNQAKQKVNLLILTLYTTRLMFFEKQKK